MLAWTASPHLGLRTTTVVSVAAGHLDLDLPDADGLDEHEREAGRGQHPDRLGDGHGQPAEMAPRRHRPDEDAGVERVVLHPDPVTEDGTARERRRRVDGEHAELRHPGAARRGDEAVDERRLPGPGGPVMPDGAASPRLRYANAATARPGAAAALDQGQQPGQGHPVAPAAAASNSVAGVGGPSAGPERSVGGRDGRAGVMTVARSVGGSARGQARVTSAPNELSVAARSS